MAEVTTSREQDECHLLFDAVQTSKTRLEAYADIKVRVEGMPGSHVFHAKVDTGADGNILPARCMKKMPPTVLLKDEKTKITAYNGTKIKHMGTLDIECNFNGKTSIQKFHVVDCEGPILVGLPACEKLDLVRLNHKVNMVKSVVSETVTNTSQLIERYPTTERQSPTAPAELLLGRKLDLLPRRTQENERTTTQRSRLEHRQQIQREIHNARIRHGRSQPVLNPGDAVYVRNRTSNTWERGKSTRPRHRTWFNKSLAHRRGPAASPQSTLPTRPHVLCGGPPRTSVPTQAPPVPAPDVCRAPLQDWTCSPL